VASAIGRAVRSRAARLPSPRLVPALHQCPQDLPRRVFVQRRDATETTQRQIDLVERERRRLLEQPAQPTSPARSYGSGALAGRLDWISGRAAEQHVVSLSGGSTQTVTPRT